MRKGSKKWSCFKSANDVIPPEEFYKQKGWIAAEEQYSERRLKGKRCHLPKSKENLKEEAGEELAELPAYNERLNTTYVPKEQFRTEFCADTQNAATLQLIQWLKMAVVSGVKQVLRPFRYRLFVQ